MAKEAVKEAVRPVVLICGDDDFAVKERGRAIFQEWSAGGGLDQERIDGAAANSAEALTALRRLTEALQTLPFFGGAKVVWLQNCNFLGEERTASTKAVTEATAQLAQQLKVFTWTGVRLLITAGKVDKRKVLFKTLEKLGTVEVHAGWSAEDKNWTRTAETAANAHFRSVGKSARADALARLVEFVGPDPRLLRQEAEKLSLYVGDRAEITVEDIQRVVARNKSMRAFALADALGARQLPALLRALDEAFWEMKRDSSVSEIGLLYGLISKVRAMLFLKEMVRRKWISAEADYYRFKSQLEQVPAEQLPPDRRLSPLGMHPYMLHQALGHARNYASTELVRAMELLLECNLRLVTSGLDEALVLQQTLIEIVRLNGRPTVS